ncbi:MAG: DUF6093 family protein [Actinoplanes sp.]
MPLQNSAVISPDWQTHHRPVAIGGMNALVEVIREDVKGVRDKASGLTNYGAGLQIYEGPGAVVDRSAVSTVVIGERETALGAYLIVIPAEVATVVVGDVVRVIRCPENPNLTGKRFNVVQLGSSSLTFQRDLGCDLQQPTNRPKGAT